jgi:hypothetical protein
MTDWISNGVSARSRWGIPQPVQHLVIDDNGTSRLWCSGGAARREENPQSRRFCSGCKALAGEAVQDGTLEKPAGWPL